MEYYGTTLTVSGSGSERQDSPARRPAQTSNTTVGGPVRQDGSGDRFAAVAALFLRVVFVAGIALALSLLLEPLIEPDFSPLFLGAVALCTWRWGARAGLLCTLLTVPSLLLLFLPPHYTLTVPSWEVFFRVLSFLSTSALIIWLVQMFMTAQRGLVGSLEEVRTREERFRVALIKSPVIVFHQDADLRYIWVFNPFPEHTGFSLLDKLDSDLFPPNEAEHLTRIKQSVLSAGVGARAEVALTSQAGVRTFDLTIEPFKDSRGETVGLLGTAVDITERRRNEEQLKHSREQFRRLAAHLHFLHESQRALTSRQIHDDVTQMLAALQLQLAAIADGLLEGAGPYAAVERLEAISQAVVATIETSEKISTDLRPSLLDNLGLAATIDSQAGKFERLTGICVIAHPLDDVDMAPEVATAAFRIVQEALSNVARHADATHVTLSLRTRADGCVLEVRDDGRGITSDEMANSASLGLLGMHELARSFGGRLTVRGIPGKGTTLRIEIPAAVETVGMNVPWSRLDDASANRVKY